MEGRLTHGKLTVSPTLSFMQEAQFTPMVVVKKPPVQRPTERQPENSTLTVSLTLQTTRHKPEAVTAFSPVAMQIHSKMNLNSLN